MKFSIALLQIKPKEFNQKFNLEKGFKACRKAKKLGADLALFPEMWNIGYPLFSPDEKEKKQWKAKAINRHSDFFQAYVQLAQELEMNIAITYLEKQDPKPRNTVSIINSDGHVMLNYSKVFLCNFGQDELQKGQYDIKDIGRDYNCSPGNTFDVCELGNEQGLVKVGAMICADREFPEAATALMKKGAELIIIPNSCDWDEIRDCQLKTRALESLAGVAMVNYPQPKNNGRSTAYDCLAFDRNPLVVKANEKENVFLATFDVDEIRKFRKKEKWRLDYRLNFKQ